MNLLRALVVSSDITSGSTYRFRLRVQNVYGFSEWSNITSVIAASRPGPVTAVTATISGTNV